MKNFTKVALIAIMVIFSSCATLFSGTSDRVSFNTEPSGATVFIDGIERCTTPCEVRVRRSINERDVRITLEGYETRWFSLERELNLISILNLGNMFGWAIDALSGAIFRFVPTEYSITLQRERQSELTHPVMIKIEEENRQVDALLTQDLPKSLIQN